ncbi:MAG: SIMPL domain-containing protein [Blastochloris viridis]|uniref:SIMPL domain-containing protein n=1 Tax=Blastochloris viridis TaxID=1079 RepID=A0A6N4RBJ8_BLAVI|nr:MAG: SIMPL domain-containing protein [Blastochloris viridis]
MSRLIESGIWAAGVVLAGYVLGSQIATLTSDSSVQVRGSAEMPVVADLATWSLSVSSSGNDLSEVQKQLSGDLAKIRAFLEKHGIPAADVEMQSLSVSDARANQYNSNTGGDRYVVSGGVSVRTANLEGIAKAKNGLDELLGQGVVLTSSYGPNYAFTKLNDAKLDLVSRATAEAYKAAEQFAKDSNSRVGGIKRATQGSVQILGRDSYLSESEQANKILRVVTTVDYTLN